MADDTVAVVSVYKRQLNLLSSIKFLVISGVNQWIENDIRISRNVTNNGCLSIDWHKIYGMTSPCFRRCEQLQQNDAIICFNCCITEKPERK
jgi:hypothetical protein